MRRNWIGKLMGIFACVLLVTAAAGVDAASITFSPFNPTVSLGQSFDLTISGSGFPETPGGDVDITWDPSLLTLTAVNFADPPWDLAGSSFDFPTWTNGAVTLSPAVFFNSNPSGAFTIAALSFDASGVNTGVSPFTISPTGWVDPGNVAFDPQPTGVGGTVNVVPLPPAIFLLGGGLAGLAALRRRRG